VWPRSCPRGAAPAADARGARQAYYLAAPFAVERAPTVALRGLKRRRGVHIAALSHYPVRGLVFEAGDALADLAAVVGGVCARLAAANVPHNLFVVDCGQRLFLFPNAFALAKAQGRVPEDLLATQARAPGPHRNPDPSTEPSARRGCFGAAAPGLERCRAWELLVCIGPWWLAGALLLHWKPQGVDEERAPALSAARGGLRLSA
jgi:hypothetical protein